MRHEEFAGRAGRRLKAVADRLEDDARRLRIDGGASKTTARAQELRVAALLVREEAEVVSEAEKRRGPATEEISENPPLEAQG